MFKKKKNKKISIIPRLFALSFVIIACAQTISLLFLSTSPEFVSAGGYLDAYKLQTPIGEKSEIDFVDNTTRPIAEYVKVIYKYAIGVVGIVAAVVLMIGGIVWLTAGGNATKVGEAKAWIGSSLTGLVLVLASYMILYQINPDLVEFKPTTIDSLTGVSNQTSGREIANPPSYSNCEKGKTKVDTASRASVASVYYYCPTGKIEVNAKYCEDIGSNICCCDALGWDQWGYQSGIEKQKDDASEDLKKIIKCMREKLPNTIGEISAISDSYVTGNDSNLQQCLNKDTYQRPPCIHMLGSCHYGNKSGASGSYAVDFGDEYNADEIIRIAKECKSPYAALEDGNHVHVSSPGCVK